MKQTIIALSVLMVIVALPKTGWSERAITSVRGLSAVVGPNANNLLGLQTGALMIPLLSMETKGSITVGDQDYSGVRGYTQSFVANGGTYDLVTSVVKRDPSCRSSDTEDTHGCQGTSTFSETVNTGIPVVDSCQ